MKKKLSVILCLSLYFFCFQKIHASDKCDIKDITKLSIYKKNDYKLYNYSCIGDEGFYSKYFLSNGMKKIFLEDFSDYASKEEPKLLAVSVYKSKNNKPPVLIMIKNSYYCCSPQLEGDLYKISLFQVNKKNDNLILNNITKTFGRNSEGFLSKKNGNNIYKYQNIASIKSWLEKNYK